MRAIDTWITESNTLYIANPRKHSNADLAKAANSLLMEWDYADAALLTPEAVYTLPEVIWVDTETAGEEYWPSDKVHKTEQDDTIEVWTYDLEEIITRSYA